MPSRFCPSCSSTVSADLFPAVREEGDLYGASLRCRPCAVADVAAERFITSHRRAAKSDPASPLAFAWQAARKARSQATRSVYLYAQSLTSPTFAPALFIAA